MELMVIRAFHFILLCSLNKKLTAGYIGRVSKTVGEGKSMGFVDVCWAEG